MLLLVGTILLIAVIVWVVWTYNLFVRYRYLVREGWSGIDVQLKRRADLVPNLVEAVKGYKQFEAKTLEEVTALRAKSASAEVLKDKSNFESKLSGVLKSIFAIVEAYPELKTNKSFLDLHKNLVEIEDQLQMARRYYNGAVRNYNILVGLFPGNVIARIFNFKSEDFFEIEYATERSVPEVKI